MELDGSNKLLFGALVDLDPLVGGTSGVIRSSIPDAVPNNQSIIPYLLHHYHNENLPSNMGGTIALGLLLINSEGAALSTLDHCLRLARPERGVRFLAGKIVAVVLSGKDLEHNTSDLLAQDVVVLDVGYDTMLALHNSRATEK